MSCQRARAFSTLSYASPSEPALPLPSYGVPGTPAGRIINRFSQDIFMTDLDFPRNTFDVILPAAPSARPANLIDDAWFVKTPCLTLAVPFLGAFCWLMLSFHLKTAKQFQQLVAASKSPLYTQFSTTLSGLVTIRALRVEQYFQSQNDGYLDRSQVLFYLRFASIRFLRAFLAMISLVLATGLSVLAVGLRHTTNLSSLTSPAPYTQHLHTAQKLRASSWPLPSTWAPTCTFTLEPPLYPSSIFVPLRSQSPLHYTRAPFPRPALLRGPFRLAFAQNTPSHLARPHESRPTNPAPTNPAPRVPAPPDLARTGSPGRLPLSFARTRPRVLCLSVHDGAYCRRYLLRRSGVRLKKIPPFETHLV
ncbi:hypothetical protein DFH09DRAFT_1312863 [Mycena vulgaris]|nr:hypothetical protein DFH09DRAFT_1312863 [Mycena vulgaris]